MRQYVIRKAGQEAYFSSRPFSHWEGANSANPSRFDSESQARSYARREGLGRVAIEDYEVFRRKQEQHERAARWRSLRSMIAKLDPDELAQLREELGAIRNSANPLEGT